MNQNADLAAIHACFFGLDSKSAYNARIAVSAKLSVVNATLVAFDGASARVEKDGTVYAVKIIPYVPDVEPVTTEKRRTI